MREETRYLTTMLKNCLKGEEGMAREREEKEGGERGREVKDRQSKEVRNLWVHKARMTEHFFGTTHLSKSKHGNIQHIWRQR